MVLGFAKPQLVLLPLIVVTHASPISQAAPQLAESSTFLFLSDVVDRSLDLTLVFFFGLGFVFFVAVCHRGRRSRDGAVVDTRAESAVQTESFGERDGREGWRGRRGRLCRL
jgi:hypothetical protein